MSNYRKRTDKEISILLDELKEAVLNLYSHIMFPPKPDGKLKGIINRAKAFSSDRLPVDDEQIERLDARGELNKQLKQLVEDIDEFYEFSDHWKSINCLPVECECDALRDRAKCTKTCKNN